MLWLFINDRPWFAAKTHGYGAGWPIAWQGWALMASYLAAMAGVGVTAQRLPTASALVLMVFAAVLTLIFVLIAKRRTRGGLKWRWGSND